MSDIQILSNIFWQNKIKHKEKVVFSKGNIKSLKNKISKSELKGFMKISRDNSLSKFSIVSSVFSFLINKYFENYQNIIKVYPSHLIELENFLLLEIENQATTFKGLLQNTASDVKEAFSHENYSSVELNLELFSNFSIQFGQKFETSIDDLSLLYEETENNIVLSLFYNENYPDYIVESLLRNLINILSDFEVLLNENIKEYSFIDGKERHQLLVEFNDTKVDYPREKTIVQLFEEQVEKNPDNIAVVFEEINLTYRELNEKANQLAHFIKNKHNIESRLVITTLLPKSIDLLISFLAIEKLGCIYLPIDINYPKDRIDYILEDSTAKIVLSEKDIIHTLDIHYPYISLESEEIQFASIDSLNVAIKPNDVSYLIYTSGSTGKPKGVLVEHHSNINMSLDQIKSFGVTSKDKIVWFASVTFDASISEIMMSLYSGATLCIPTEEQQKDKNKFISFLEKTESTVITFPPSYLELLSSEDLKSVKTIITAGEPANPIKAKQVIEYGINYYNAYGPTEYSVCTSIFRLEKHHTYVNVPIGRPISNTEIYILDDDHGLVPVGVSGKLYISGAGLSRGYLNKPDLTAEKFIANPFNPGAKMYDTGDLARWLPDGNIEFLGRKDFQVKIRGYRIELGEIESHILQFSKNIHQVVVDAREVNGEKVLAAYYTSGKESSIDKSSLREYLQSKLPDYMVPGFFVELGSIPLTANGKIDRKALPGITGDDLIRREYVAPRNATEEKLSEIWQEVLGLDRVGITDNFFELGGHSLMVAQVLNRIHQNLAMEISFKDFFAEPNIEGITRNLIGKEYTQIQKAPVQESYPLTPSQQRLWVLSQLEGGSQAYNMPAVVTLRGELNEMYFEKAFQHLIDRHEILRTSFKSDQATGEIQQYITPKEELHFTIEVLDFKEKNESEVEDYLQTTNNEAFNLEESPLIRATLLKRGNEEHLFFLSMHHIIGDGWSTEVLVSEVVENYNNLLNGNIKEGEILKEELTIQYKDYAVWLQKEIKGEKYQRAEAYWLEEFEGEIPVLELPSYRARPLIQTYNGNSLSHLFSKEFTEKLEQYSEKHGATLFMTLMAGVKSLLYRYTGQQDIIVGTPIAGREHPDLENQIGLYLNTLAIRTRLAEDHNTFESVLAKEKETLLSAYEHQLYPFDELVGKLNLKRDPSRSALFDVMVVFQNQNKLHFGNTTNDIEGLKVEGYGYYHKTSQFDMSYTFAEEAGQLGLTIEYNTDIYDEFLIKRMFCHFENLLTVVVENTTEIIENVDLLTQEERDQLLIEFNDKKVDYSTDKTIIQLFEEQVKKTPENVAVVFEDIEVTYRELNEQANQLGAYLRQNYKIQPDDFVAIKLGRSEKMIIAILGVLKSGAAYVPIDPEYPQERIEYIEQDTKAKITVDEAFLQEIWKEENPYTKENLPVITRPENLAYVIYTSGTTGQPKGVMIENKSVVSIYECWKKEYELEKININLLQLASISFDVFVGDLCRSILNGGKMIISSNDTILNVQSLYDLLKKNQVSILDGTPSLLLNLCDEIFTKNLDFSFLKIFVFGSDSFNNQDYLYVKEKFGESIKVINSYGVTEATIDSSFFDDSLYDFNGITPIGKPFSNSTIYIGNSQKLFPTGVYGKMYISGDGLARGYLNRPELTSEKFIDNPFEPGTKMYDTGDLARWLPDGNIEFLGRKDFQVKIRGYRIELGEIETNLSQFSEHIKQVVVDAKEVSKEKVLVAYYTTDKETEIEKSALRTYLQGKLPDYMVPGFFVELDSIPLTSNGKIDRRSLPGVTGEDLIRREYIAPRNETEEKLVEIWQEVLGIEKVGITDNFFELGGHSLMMVQVLNKIHQRLSLQISFNDFFSKASIADLSNKLAEKIYNPIPKALEAISYPLSAAQKRIWVLSQLENSSVAYNMPGAVKLSGEINKNKLEESFKLLIHRHEILRTYFKANREGEVFQYIVPVEQAHFRLEEEDYSLMDNQENAVTNYLQGKNKKIFDLEKAVLMQASLIKLTQSEYIFFLSMHHIIGDGWSMELLISEVIKTYNALMQGEELALPEDRIQYKDFAVWQNEELQKQKFKISEQYWLKQFEGDIPVLNLPSFKSRPLIQTYNGDSLIHQFSTEFLEKLKEFSKKHDATLFMTLMAGINILLNKYTGQNDIILGTPIAGRQHAELENQLGLFLNTLAIRTRLEEEESFLDILSKEKESLSNAYQHQDYPFDELVTKLNFKKDTSRSALFDVMVVLQNQDQLKSNHKEGLLDLEVSEYSFSRMMSQSDIRFAFTEKEGLELMIDYNTDIYDTHLIERMFTHFRNLMERLIENPEKNSKEIEYLSDPEERQLIKTFNSTKIDYPKEKTIVELFEDQVLKTPDHVAVVFEEIKLTYKELNEKANQLACYLRDNYSVKADDFVGIKLNRNEMLIVAILGVLKSGAAYVPIDTNYPEERLAYIEKDTDCKVVLDEDRLMLFNSQRFRYSEENLKIINVPSDLAYVIYTSGSTGLPKGVMVEHRNVVRLVKPCSFFPLHDRSILLSTGSISFDATIIEFFGTLLNGAQLILTSQDNLMDLSKLEDIVKKHDVNCLWMTASWFNNVVESKISLFKYISQLIVGGDVVSTIYTHKVFNVNPDIKIVNGYGPTENTTFSTTFDIQNEPYITIPIGKPIPNSFAYILDESMHPVLTGVIGKLYVGGDGIARGYLNNIDLTKEKFVTNIFEDGIIYDTGDLARWLPDGNIEFMGRKDRQVKIRGYRIELGEIETIISHYSFAIKHIVADTKEVNGERVLVVYYTKIEGIPIDKAELREYLQSKLPEYMIPGFFIEMEAIPLTLNGKVDREALPNVTEDDLIRSSYAEPGNKTEQEMAEIWQEVLGVEKVGITDNFFDMGGDSILSIRLLSKMNKLLEANYKLSDIFELPSISGLLSIRAERVEDEISQITKQEVEESFASLSKELDSEEISSIYPISDIELGMLYTSAVDNGKGIYHDQFIFPIPMLDFDLPVFTQAVKLLMDKHEILRTAFNFENYSVPVHLIYREVKISLDVEGILSKDKKAQYEYISEFMAQERTENPFDLSRPGLWRMKIYKQGIQQWYLLFQFHHAILDGWSVASLITELNNTYLQLLDNPALKPKKLSLSYKDYVFNQNCIKKTNSQYEYWENKLIDYTKLGIFTGEVISKRYEYILEGELYNSVQNFIAEQGLTMKILNFSAYLYALQILTYNNDITVGLVTNGRPLSEDGDKLLGCFLNTVPFRLKGRNSSILEFIKGVDQAVNTQKKFEGVSLLELRTRFSNDSKGENPFFDTFFNYIDFHIYNELNFQEKHGDKESQFLNANFEATNTFLDLTVCPIANGVEISWHLQRNLRNGLTIEQIQEYYLSFLKLLVSNPDTILDRKAILSSEERDLLLVEFNNTKVDYPSEKKIVQLFEEQVEKTPANVAVVFEESELSYLELNEEANQLGDYLRQNHHIEADDLIAIKLERSEKMIVAILGILKSGAAYVPIDPEYPQERIEYIEQDTNAKVTIDEAFLESYQKDIQKKENQYTKENLPIISRPDSLAYVIYTSGTTGQPKGVMIENHSLINRLVWMQKAYSLTPEDTLIQKTTYSFDVSVWELLWWGIYGGKLSILAPKHEKSPSDIIDNIHKNKVTVIHFVPSMLMVFLNYLESNIEHINRITSLRQVFVSGEALTIPQRDLFYKLLPEISLVNLYGPTEASIDVTYFNCSEEYSGQSIPIGKPIDNTSMYILNESMDISPVGVPGNLYVSGVGLSRGYLNKPELTAEKFVDNPFEKGTKMYDTGDVARWLPDGNIEYLGRKDFQVKIRGYRIELGEVETNISQFSSSIKQVVAEAKEANGEKVLVVYYTNDSETIIDKSELREYLQSKLPEYMVPGFFVELASIPLTPNGKIDRRALPDVTGEDVIRKEYVAPRNETEQKLTEIWEKVLGVEKVGITDNFFEMGGHSLMVVQVLNRMHQTLSMQLSFKDFFASPTIKGITKNLTGKEYIPIPKAAEHESYPLTPSQHRLWVLSQLEGGSQAYNMPAVVSLKGKLNKEYFEKSFQYLIARHEILRTSFKSDKITGEIRQYISPKESLDFNIEVLDFTGKTESEIEDYLQSSNSEAFNLEESPLIRATLLKRGNGEHLFFLSMHHIIGDGWSTEVLVSEVIEAYNHFVKEESCSTIDSNGNKGESPELSIQYKDYAVWLQEEIRGEKYQRAEMYWLEQFEGELPVLELPSYKTRPLIQTYNGDNISHSFSKEFTKKLKQYSEKHGATLFMTLMAGVKSLLYRYTGQQDIIVGTPIAGREHPDLENQIGLYLNTLAIRTRLTDGHNTFESVLAKEKETLLSAYEHQLYPFDELVGKLNLKRDTSRSVLFDVMVVFQNQSQLHLGTTTNDIEGLKVDSYDYQTKISQFDMSYTFAEEAGQLGLTIEYNTDIYDDFLIQRIFGHFENLLRKALEDQEGITGIEDLDYLTSEERDLLLTGFTDTKVDYPRDKTIIQLFEAQVEDTPENVAIEDSKIELTYKELSQKSDRVAQYLVSHLGNSNEPVGVLVDRSAELIILLLGILKSGKSYIPIDPMLPKERIEYIINHSHASVIISEESFLQEFNSVKTSDNSTNPENKADFIAKEKLLQFESTQEENINPISKAGDTAYIIYTSGSTGNPKGVEIGHQALTNFLTSIQRKPEVGCQDILYSVTTYSFDISILEFFTPLISGASVFIADKETLNDAEQLKKELEKINPTIIQATPSFYQMLFNAGWKGNKDLKILCGGDRLNELLAEKLLNHSKEVWNMYGPTETTIWSSTKKIEEPSDASNIGKPINNTQIYIVDQHHNLVPQNTVGRIFIAGDGLAKGYYKNEALTEEKFIENPFSRAENNNPKMYETGDLGKWNEEGEIEFLGRNDFQVKVRGFRIELGEIESRLEEYPDIKQCVADAKEVNGEKVLVVYYTKDSEISIDKTGLREYLQSKLPEYMVPGFFVELDSIPLTPNGKIDRKALPGVTDEDLIRREYVAPRNETEQKLVEIWQEILGIERVGIKDNFFELGGDSISGIRIINKILESGYKCTVKELYNSQNIDKLSVILVKIEETEVKSQYSHYKNAKFVNISQKLIDKLENKS